MTNVTRDDLAPNVHYVLQAPTHDDVLCGWTAGTRVMLEFDDGSPTPKFRRHPEGDTRFLHLRGLALAEVPSPRCTRADIKPGAVFLLQKATHAHPAGTRFVISEDDGTDCPYFRRVDAYGKEDGATRCFDMNDMSLEVPAEPATAVPTRLLQALVDAERLGRAGPRIASHNALLAFIETAVLSADEVAARALLEGRGWTVSRAAQSCATSPTG